MTPTCKTPAGKAGASRDSLGGWSRFSDTVEAGRVQILIGAHHVRPELAVMLAALAWGGPHHG